MLSDVRPQIQLDADEDAERVVALATASAGRLIRKLMIESITSWASQNFDRYDEREVSFTVRLYACMREVKEAHRGQMLMIHPDYDGPLPSAKMLQGLADVGETPRPDLTVKCGEATIHIEAKRLMPNKGLPAKYVNEGMMRFVDGRYISSGSGFSLMLGYILNGEPADSYGAVNHVIETHDRLRPDEIAEEREVIDKLTIYVSTHSFGEISHYAVDVRLRQPSTMETQGIVRPPRRRKASGKAKTS